MNNFPSPFTIYRNTFTYIHAVTKNEHIIWPHPFQWKKNRTYSFDSIIIFFWVGKLKDNETFCWRVWNAWLELFCSGDYSFSRKPVSSLCFTCLCLFLLGMVKDGTRLIGNGLSCCQKLLFFYGSQHACPNILTDAKHGVCYSDNTKVAWPGHDDISD